MYKKKYYIGSNDVDQFFDLKLPSFFKMMQDISTEHAELIGIGKETTLDKGLFWVITRIEIEITRMPKYLENVYLITYPGDNMRFMFPRYFRLEDEKGNCLMKASSLWMVLDRANHRISLNPFPEVKLPEEHMPDELPLPNKVVDQEGVEVEKRKVRYCDIDLNGHLNNTKYIDYIIDIHDSDFYKNHKIKHFLINYEKEIIDNNVLTLLTNNGNPEVIKGKLEDKTSFIAQIDYKDQY